MNSFVLSILLHTTLLLVTLHTTTAIGTNPPFFHFSFGDINATVVSDGVLVFEQSIWLVPENAVRRSFEFYSTPTFPFLAPQNVLIMDLPSGDRVMVDTGSLAFTKTQPLASEAGQLIKNMQAAGIAPASIDKVILTHAHFDHFGGLTDMQGKKSFPNAKIYINKQEHEVTTRRELVDLPPPFPNDLINSNNQGYQELIAKFADDLILLDSFETVIPGIKLIPSPGHTDNHHSVEVVSRGKKLLVVGDAWANRAGHLVNPDWGTAVETNGTTGYETRIKLMEKAVENKDLVLTFHENFPGLGYVIRNGPWFDWVVAPTRFRNAISPNSKAT